MDKAIILESNEFSRIYEYEGVKLYVAKAFDDINNKHYLICSIPEIPELNVLKIQYPMEFHLEADRDSVFETFDAKDFIDAIKSQIVKNKEEYIDGKN